MRASFALLCLLLTLLLPCAVRAETAPPQTAAVTNFWFPIGEELVYHAYWGVLMVAETRTTATWTNYNDRPVIALRVRSRSTKFLSAIYPVDDTIETLVDPATFLPLRFTKILNEGRYHTHEETIFDHAALRARWKNYRRGTEKEFAIEPQTRDLMALMYYLRQSAFVPGTQMEFRVMSDEKMYDLSVKVQDRESVEVGNYGKRPSIRLEPEAAFEGLFVRKGKLTLWVSDDDRRVMTRILAVVPVANVRINLMEIHGPGEDFWIRERKK